MNDYAKILETHEFHAKSLVSIVRAVEEKYGKEGVEAVRNAWLKEVFYKPWQEKGRSVERNDVQTFARILESGCAGTHEWKRTEDEPNKVAYRFTKCFWADVFRKLGAEDVGKWLCDSDQFNAKGFNPDIKLKRTKTLMEGEDCCDHVFYMEGEK